jgi:hypothetical protein
MDFAQFERDVIAGKITDFESYFKEADENDAIELKQICIKHDAYQEAYPEWASNNDCVQYDLVDKGYCLDILIHSRNKVIRQAVIRKDIRYATEKHILAFDPDIIYSELMGSLEPNVEVLEHYLNCHDGTRNMRALTLKYEAMHTVPTTLEATMSPLQLYDAENILWVMSVTGWDVIQILYTTSPRDLLERKLKHDMS